MIFAIAIGRQLLEQVALQRIDVLERRRQPLLHTLVMLDARMLIIDLIASSITS